MPARRSSGRLPLVTEVEADDARPPPERRRPVPSGGRASAAAAGPTAPEQTGIRATARAGHQALAVAATTASACRRRAATPERPGHRSGGRPRP